MIGGSAGISRRSWSGGGVAQRMHRSSLIDDHARRGDRQPVAPFAGEDLTAADSPLRQTVAAMQVQAEAELADPKLPTPCRNVLVSLQEHHHIPTPAGHQSGKGSAAPIPSQNGLGEALLSFCLQTPALLWH
jgi:hypothetical protein